MNHCLMWFKRVLPRQLLRTEEAYKSKRLVMENGSKSLEEELLGELECPICLEYMLPPITLCESGHNICNTCKPRLQNCPTCKQKFLQTRNLSLEKFARKLECPCCYRKYGCQQTFPFELISQHQNVCYHRPYGCPLARTAGTLCEWEGIYSEIKSHVKSTHRGKTIDLSVKRHVFVKKFQIGNVYHKVVFSNNEIFYQEFEVRDGDFYFVLQYVGPEECASNFQFEFILSANKGNERIGTRLMTSSHRLDIRTIQRSGKCVKLHYNVLQNFMEDGENLSFEFGICKLKETNLLVEP